MLTETWKASSEVVIATGTLNPPSHVGSAYMLKGVDLFIMTWRGKDEWESKWFVEDDCIKFEYIKSSQGTIVNWGSGKALKRFIPARHLQLAAIIAKEEGKRLFDLELFH
jgi:hypothetical protein